jgi:hypothetical protein
MSVCNYKINPYFLLHRKKRANIPSPTMRNSSAVPILRASVPLLLLTNGSDALSSLLNSNNNDKISRRAALSGCLISVVGLVAPQISNAAGAEDIPDRFNVDDYLRTGIVANPMGVSGQAGKSRPETGV